MASASNPFGSGSAAINDDFDMNDFVNLDQDFHTSPSPTSVKLEPHQSLDPRDMMLQGSSQQQRQQYNGPSHNYDQFRQQTGLPTGAISHVHAVNQFSNSTHVRPTNFGAAHFGGYNTGIALDVDGQDQTDPQNYFFPGDTTDDYAIDPSAIAPDSQPSTAFRAWPGMHSQQAKQQAQAQADTQKQRREDALQAQQPLPTDFKQALGGRSRSQTSTSEQTANEQISRLLNQMRQNSNVLLNDDEDGNGNLANMSTTHGRKAEEDMDEDERLLASEEGKKLSSKERRQLRNKVSARAFRLRRKEHITTLEGEVTAKMNECNDLKMTNRHLLEQNRQLTQLCKAMLGHPGFSTFMEDMSNDPSLLQAFPQQPQSSTSSSQTAPRQQETVKPEQGPTPTQPQQPQSAQEHNIHVGVTMVPETNLDFSVLNLGANHWNNFQQPQIFMMHEVPAGPSTEAIMTGPLSGKEDAEIILEETTDKSDGSLCRAKEPPQVGAVNDKTATEEPREDNLEDIKDDPKFALYLDVPANHIKSDSTTDLPTALTRLETSLTEKAEHHFEMHVRSRQTNTDATRTVDRLFAKAEPLLRRVERATRHLDV